ncbi:MAG: hypothetical protein QCI38_06450 [Candidatus Thermoplasmatota archaeon]|nr:hypothetical protein [Candidatus Thermoplasmatota archaeon]
MRIIRLEEWVDTPKKESRAPRQRPTPKWKIDDSVEYIRMRDRYLQEKRILVRTGPRSWRLNLK